MNRVPERPQLPNQTGSGPHQAFLGWLAVALQTLIAELARRLNLTAPKDGSELQKMTSYDSAAYAMTGDVDDADVGYYTIAKFVLTGGSWSLGGVANGAGQEGVGGRVLTILNASATELDLTVNHEDAGSAAANRFLLPRGFSVTIGQYMAMSFWYDLAALRWRVWR